MPPTAKTTPRHIAIIMDGNGRWAKTRGLPRIKGHEAGAQAVRECAEGCGDLKVEYLTLYAFSAENSATLGSSDLGVLFELRHGR